MGQTIKSTKLCWRQAEVLKIEELKIELGDVFCHVLKLAEAYGQRDLPEAA